MRSGTVSTFDPAFAGESLSEQESAEAFSAILGGGVPEEELADFLIAMTRRGPTVPEIVGAARVMRDAMTTVRAPDDAIDLCGTGGDGHDTLNISTAVSFVVAGCGVPVAKHGNRSATSRAGAADVLEALGVRIDIDAETATRCLEEAGLCFLFAQTYHPALKRVAAVRKRIGMRTIFNLLGPLCNPAGAQRQLLGVYAKEWLEPLAEVLAELGAKRAWLVHGRDGLDELTTTEISDVAILDRGEVGFQEVAPEEAGLQRATLAQLKGGDAGFNANALADLLEGHAAQSYRDIVLLNAAAALVVAGKAGNLAEGKALALESVESGGARDALAKLVTITQGA